MADLTWEERQEIMDISAMQSAKIMRPSWHGPSLHGAPPIHGTADTSLRSSMHGVSVHGKFSSKITAADKQRVLEELQKTVFLPWSKKYKTWWFFTVFAAIFSVFFETICVAFLPAGFPPSNSSSALIEYILVVVFLVDMIVSFNLAYYDEHQGIVIYDRNSIRKHYMRRMFWVDLIGIFPFYLIVLACAGQIHKNTHLSQFLALSRLSRLVRSYRVFKLFRILQYNSHVSFTGLTLIRNFSFAIVWSHMAACAMYFIARQFDFSDHTWLGSKLDVAFLSTFERYVVALYWSIVTFATVGYGDFSATNNVYEQIFSMIYILLNIIIQAWMIGSITLLIVKGDEKTGVFRDALHVLHQYSALNSFDKPFEKGLRTQLKLEFDNREIADEQVLRHFPSSVRRKVLRRLYLPSLMQTDLMKGVRQQFVDAFLATCKVEIFSPGEEIVQRGSIASDLYLLVAGSVKVLPWDTGRPENTKVFTRSGSIPDSNDGQSTQPAANGSIFETPMEAGDFVNEIGFFTESPQLETIRTVTVCKTLTMSRSAYKAIAEDHPGSISRILNNLLEKVQDLASEYEEMPGVKLTKPLETLQAGSVFDDNDDPSYHNDVRRSVAAVQTQNALSSVQDLVKTHMNKLKDDHTTRFLFAASRDDVATISLMCEHGFDPNTADYDSRTALMVASMKGNVLAVNKLLSCHANPNLTDMHGSSALLEATRCGHSEIVNVLIKHGADLCMSESKAASTLCQAVFDGDIVLLRRLLQAGVDVNASDYDKRSPAHIAAAEGNVAAMRILVEFGADLSLRDRWNNTIDDEAERSHSGPMASFLESLKQPIPPQSSQEDQRAEDGSQG